MSTTTVRMKAADIYKDWHVIDAAGRPLGRVATEAARLLRGKHKPTFEPHLDDGDFVIVINASKVRLTGNKAEQKRYYRHSGYPGGLKERTFEQMMATFPERVIEQAVWGMLPNGPLGRRMHRHLKVYRGPDHPHQSQVVGSQRAREAREAALAESAAASAQKPPPRLRPLPVREEIKAARRAEEREALAREQEAAEEAARVEEEARAKEEAAARAEEEAAAKEEAAAEAPAEPEAVAPAAEPETSEAAQEAPAETGEEAKPARRSRSRKKATEETAEAPPAAEEPAEEPKPRRRRTRKKEEPSAEAEQPAEQSAADAEEENKA